VAGAAQRQVPALTAAVCASRECRRPLGSSPSEFWCSDASLAQWTADQNGAVSLPPGGVPPVGSLGCAHLGYRGVTLAKLLGRTAS
jgi:hypothetical protein